jgi:steroid 5-alpha reductase family enzyme
MHQHGLDFSTMWYHLTWPGRTLLVGVTAWGVRLFYRIASRSIVRGQDDPRYAEAKKEPGFWNDAFFSLFLPEAVTQAIIMLPFTAPFRYGPQHRVPENAEVIYATAVGLYSAGFTLEALADWQIENHKRKGRPDLCRRGVWSIVRHPK